MKVRKLAPEAHIPKGARWPFLKSSENQAEFSGADLAALADEIEAQHTARSTNKCGRSERESFRVPPEKTTED